MKPPEIHLPWFISRIPTSIYLSLRRQSIEDAARQERHALRRDFWYNYTPLAMSEPPQIPMYDMCDQLTVILTPYGVAKINEQHGLREHVPVDERVLELVPVAIQ